MRVSMDPPLRKKKHGPPCQCPPPSQKKKHGPGHWHGGAVVPLASAGNVPTWRNNPCRPDALILLSLLRPFLPGLVRYTIGNPNQTQQQKTCGNRYTSLLRHVLPTQTHPPQNRRPPLWLHAGEKTLLTQASTSRNWSNAVRYFTQHAGTLYTTDRKVCVLVHVSLKLLHPHVVSCRALMFVLYHAPVLQTLDECSISYLCPLGP